MCIVVPSTVDELVLDSWLVYSFGERLDREAALACMPGAEHMIACLSLAFDYLLSYARSIPIGGRGGVASLPVRPSPVNT